MIPDAYRRVVSELDPGDLRDILRGVASRELQMPIAMADQASLESAAFSKFGFELLSHSQIRFHLLQSLTESELLATAHRCNASAAGQRMDVALRLASLPWRYGATIVDEIASRFRVPDIMLPPRRSTLSALEEVEPHSPLGALHDYQVEACRLVTDGLLDPSQRALLLQLPTGAGKTRVMMEAVCNFLLAHPDDRPTILWLAHTEELCDQAFESFVRLWGSRGDGVATVARYWGDHRLGIHELRGNVVIGSYQKLTSLVQKAREDTGELLGQDCVLIADEAHKALAPSIRPIVEMVKQGTRCTAVGLTATPGRHAQDDGPNRQLVSLFDGQLIQSSTLGPDPIRTLQERGILARMERVSLTTGAPISELDDDEEPTAATLKRLSNDSRRNEIIVESVATQVGAGRQTLVFCCSVEHAEGLALRSALGGVASAHIDCRMRRYARRRTVDAFRSGSIDVLFNFGVLSTGFDAPSVRCVIVARPTSSIVLYSQMIGRGLRGRLVGGSDDFVLIDLVDNQRAFGDLDGVYRHFADYWSPQR